MSQLPLSSSEPRPEAELLLCLVGECLNPAGNACMPALPLEDQDWSGLIALADAHKALPLLCRHLKDLPSEIVPGAVQEELHRRAHRNTALNLLLTHELIRVLELFDRHGMPAIPFKGPTLAISAYRNLALRQFVDLDLLLRPRDLARARELLVAEGYRVGFKLTGKQELAHLESISQLPLIGADGVRFIELHSELMPRWFYFPLDFERLHKRLQTVSLNGKKVPAPSPEDLLLLLCAHGAKHLWSCLGWVCDVAALVQNHPDLNWPQVMEEARALRSMRMLLLGLHLAHDLLRIPLPEGILRNVQRDGTVAGLAMQVRGLLFGDLNSSLAFRMARFHLKVREHAWDGIRYALSLVFEPTVADWQAHSLAAPLSSYYLLRPLRLIGKYGKKLLPR